MKMFFALAAVCTLCFTILTWIESGASSRRLLFWQGRTYKDSTTHPQKNYKKSGGRTQKNNMDTMKHKPSGPDSFLRSDKLDPAQIH